MGGADISTKCRGGRKDGSPAPRPQIYMFGDPRKGSEARGSAETCETTPGLHMETKMPNGAHRRNTQRMRSPRVAAIAASVANALCEYGMAEKILLVVGSTSAYCAGGMGRISFAKLQRQIRRRSAGAKYLSLRAPHGDKYADFAWQIKEEARGCAVIFDSLVPLGEWEDDEAPVEYIQSMALMVTERRAGDFAAYLGTSDG